MIKIIKRQLTKNRILLLVSVFICIAVVVSIITTLAIIFNKNSTESTMAEIDTNREDNIQNIENLQNEELKSEEELKEINEKEIKEAEEQAKKEGKEVNTKSKYFIRVNVQAQVINVYTYDEDGNYTVPVTAFVCSTGSGTPSSGTYTMASSGGNKRRVWTLYGNVYGQYVTPIVSDILFHSVPYLRKDGNDVAHDSLKYWEYDKLGTKASMGCIRLTTRDAKWIYDNVSLWTKVEFYSSSNPGPFGKPSAQKISNAPEYLRNWDPTDPDPDNPWRNYNPEKEEEEKNDTKNEEVIDDKDNVVNNETVNNVVGNSQTQNNTIENNTIENNTINNEIEDIFNNITETENNTVSNNEIINNTIENVEKDNNS